MNIISYAGVTKLYCNPILQADMLRQDLLTVKSRTEKWVLKLNEKKRSVSHIGKKNPNVPYEIKGPTIVAVEHQMPQEKRPEVGIPGQQGG
ncbi:hypothetical protein HHI36_018928 [Cryptolaemus montrouzieri]|uniref:Uncharacterized protein n=1 Tax=Cryptolaemus montrouzieri TaxID=559131 RepID=A0ABD2P1H6_9CUCU